jgi:hypothetical protein
MFFLVFFSHFSSFLFLSLPFSSFLFLSLPFSSFLSMGLLACTRATTPHRTCTPYNTIGLLKCFSLDERNWASNTPLPIIQKWLITGRLDHTTSGVLLARVKSVACGSRSTACKCLVPNSTVALSTSHCLTICHPNFVKKGERRYASSAPTMDCLCHRRTPLWTTLLLPPPHLKM